MVGSGASLIWDVGHTFIFELVRARRGAPLSEIQPGPRPDATYKTTHPSHVPLPETLVLLPTPDPPTS